MPGFESLFAASYSTSKPKVTPLLRASLHGNCFGLKQHLRHQPLPLRDQRCLMPKTPTLRTRSSQLQLPPLLPSQTLPCRVLTPQASRPPPPTPYSILFDALMLECSPTTPVPPLELPNLPFSNNECLTKLPSLLSFVAPLPLTLSLHLRLLFQSPMTQVDLRLTAAAATSPSTPRRPHPRFVFPPACRPPASSIWTTTTPPP